jgi:DNA primase
MSIPDEDVQAVRQSTDIVALVSEYTPLKRVGRRYVGLCPFHSEKSGSFSVNAEEGLYYCFGCQASGDAITFLRAIEGATFVEAVERLGARVGIAVRNEASPRDKEARDKRDALYDAMAQAVAFYHDRLLRHEDAARARQYLRSRGLDGDIVRQFQLGWAPEGGNHLVRGIKVSTEALVGAGLALQGNYGPRDAFRGRIIFPICQTDGKPVALGGRLVPGIGDGSGPKYRNSSETPIYQKRSTLYALNLSRQAIVHDGDVIVCEGYTDVIGMYRVGLPKAVATCGTALTEEHFKLLARFGRRIILAFDADGAGQAAAARFYEWEQRHEAQVAVADLPVGSDPGELASSDPDRLRAAVENARSYLDFRVRRTLSSGDLQSVEGRARAAEAAIAVIAEHPNALVRDQYLVEVADRTRTGYEQLRPLLAAAVARGASASRPQAKRPSASSPPPSTAPRSSGAPSGGGGRGGVDDDDDAPPPSDDDAPPDDWDGPPTGGRATAPTSKPAGRGAASIPGPSLTGQRAGRDVLALAIHEPAALAGRLDECLFTEELQRRAFRSLASAASLHEAIDQADDEVAQLLVELANSDPEIGVDQALVALVRTRAIEALRELEADARVAHAEGDEQRLAEHAASTAWLKSELETFGDVGAGDHPPRGVTDAADRLLAWLLQRRGEAA